jgi:TDG/mug DNA glycosylase family protein
MLDDLLAHGLKLVFCGSAAGTRSAQVGQYYAGRGNKFWSTLKVIGLTTELLSPSDFRKLLSYGIGLTDLVKGQSGMDVKITFGITARDDLRTKMLKYRPRVLSFNGKRAAKEFFGRKHMEFGLQAETIGSTKLFLAPSTSGAAGGS